MYGNPRRTRSRAGKKEEKMMNEWREKEREATQLGQENQNQVKNKNEKDGRAGKQISENSKCSSTF